MQQIIYSWNDLNSDPIADLRAMHKMMIEACQICGGSTWLITPISKYPYTKTVKCSYCEGTGKLPQYRSRRFGSDSAMEMGMEI